MDLTTNVATLAALSMASERLVQIFRGLPKLAFPKRPSGDNSVGPARAQQEATRVATINFISIIAGMLTAVLAYSIDSLPGASNWGEACIFGVLAGAGSGFWNAVLSYLVQVKDLKKALTEAENRGVAARTIGAG